jgi:hypothetical protein
MALCKLALLWINMVQIRDCPTTLTGAFPSSACYPLHADLLLGLFFDPEDGGDMFL